MPSDLSSTGACVYVSLSGFFTLPVVWLPPSRNNLFPNRRDYNLFSTDDACEDDDDDDEIFGPTLLFLPPTTGAE